MATGASSACSARGWSGRRRRVRALRGGHRHRRRPAAACSPQGSDRAAAGAGTIAQELSRAAVRGEEATGAIRRLRDGSERLADGQRQAVGRRASPWPWACARCCRGVRGGELARARQLASQLGSRRRGRSALRPAANQARVLARTIASTATNCGACATARRTLNGGLNRLVPGGRRLKQGVAQLADAADGLSGGLRPARRRRRTPGRRADRTARRRRRSQAGLAKRLQRSYPLQARLRRAGVRVSRSRRRWRSAPGAAPRSRTSSTPATSSSRHSTGPARPTGRCRRRRSSIARGGQAARLLVVSTPASTPTARADRRAAAGRRRAFGRRSDLQTGVTGGAAVLNTYGRATEDRLPLVIGAFVLFTPAGPVVDPARAPAGRRWPSCLNLPRSRPPSA